MGAAPQREREVCMRQEGVLRFVPSPSGEWNWDAVRVIEVGDLGRRKPASRPCLFCFSLTNRQREPARSRSTDAGGQQAGAEVPGRPAGLARPGRAFQDRAPVSLSLPAFTFPIGIPTPKTRPERKGADSSADLSSQAGLLLPSAEVSAAAGDGNRV